MAARPKLIADRTKHRTETRAVPQALEPLPGLARVAGPAGASSRRGCSGATRGNGRQSGITAALAAA
jgi:hypothetical protein